ncbi:MAG: PfkB family carbohydrate kinase [Candidatus Hodarchaeaceae archaeon]|nr:PfkB family carbohydrate kinase [Candidatus Hodarchaeaceae archaeon]
MEFDAVVIGHVAIDVNVLPWGVIENVLGGAPTYAGLMLAALRKNVGIVSKVGADFPDKFPPLYRKLDLDTEGILVTGEHTTTFENIYDEAGYRKQVCKYVAKKISPDDIPRAYHDAQSFYVSPIAGEITADVLKSIKRKTNTVMLDPQGLLRRIDREGKVEIGPREDLDDFLRHVDIVKIGRDEAKALEGDVGGILEDLRRMGPKIAILTQGEKGCAMLSEEGFNKIKSLRVEARDLTGAGDVFGAAFLARYIDTRDAVKSAKFAAVAAGLKIRYRGPTGFPSEKEILSAIG